MLSVGSQNGREQGFGAQATDVDNVLTVRSRKTDQTGEGKSLYIGDSTRRAIRNHAKRGGVEAGALFRRIRRGGGRIRRCQFTMPARNSQNGARLQGSNMASDKTVREASGQWPANLNAFH
jgi:hypothetical protein